MANSYPTFLYTDIEGSQRLWEQNPEAMRTALVRYDALLRQLFVSFQGTVFQSHDGAFRVVFSNASDAAAAARAAQQALIREPWGKLPIQVRMVLHSGPAIEKDGCYDGPSISHLTTLLKAAHGKQILLSSPVRDQLTENGEQPGIHDLGSHPLQDLHSTAHLYQLIVPDLPGEFPPPHSLNTYTHNLPIQRTPFIGREKEISEIGRRLVGKAGGDFALDQPFTTSASPTLPSRLVTLVGVNGSGKTRLALQTAAHVLEYYADGIWLVEVGTLVDPELVPQMIAKELGVTHKTRKELLNSLIDYLRRRQLLLVWDQCEHLLDACAQLADTLLRSCPNLRILVTSREELQNPGEIVFRMPSLTLPEIESTHPAASCLAEYLQSEAIALFVVRAAASQPEFALTEQNAPILQQICQRLDGLPLAIELAAMRVKTLPVERISDRIENRFRLLTGSPRTTLSPHLSIRAIFDWSYDLLSPSERTLLNRLAVFTGSWTLPAATAVCADSQQMAQSLEQRAGSERRTTTSPWKGAERRSGLDRRSLSHAIIPAPHIADLLAHLQEKGLIIPVAVKGQTRFRMLETIRQFSQEKLLSSGEAEKIHSHHLMYFAGLAVKADTELWAAEQAAWLGEIDADMDNFRAALEWAEASPEKNEVEAGLQLAGSLWQFWIVLGCWSEGCDRLERLLARFEIDGSTPEMARALNLAGILSARIGESQKAHSYLEQALSIGQKLADRFKIAYSHYGLGLAAFLEANPAVAQEQYETSLSIFRAIDHKAGLAVVLHDLGDLALRNREAEKARQYFEESQVICKQMGNKLGAAEASNALGTIAKTNGKLVLAQSYYQEAFTLLRNLHYPPGVAAALLGLGNVALANKEMGVARTCLEECLGIQHKLGNKKKIAYILTRLDEIARSQGDYTASRTFYEESLLVLGEINPAGGILAALNDLGNASLLEADHQQAASFFQEAVTLALETGDNPGIASNLVGLASVYHQVGKADRLRWTARLLGQAETILQANNASPNPSERSQMETIGAALRIQLGDDLFDAMCEEGRKLPLGQVISYVMGKNPLA